MIPNHKSKSKKEKLPFYIEKFKSVVFLIVLLITVPAYYFLIRPQYNIYQTNQRKLKQLDNQSKLSIQQLLANNKIITDYESINPLDKKKIEQILPQTPDLASLYVNLEALVAQNGLGLETMTVEPVKVVKKKVIFADDSKLSNDEIGIVNINLVVTEVSYAKLKKLFASIESNVRLFDVQNFNFDPAEGNLTIAFKTYYLLTN